MRRTPKSRGNWPVSADICKGCGRVKKFCKCKEISWQEESQKETVAEKVKGRTGAEAGVK